MNWTVFPATLTPDKVKLPLVKGYFELATTDPKQIAAWQQQFGSRITFFGVPTGPKNNLLVLDVDVKNGENGFETLKQLGIVLPHTLTQTTPSGGLHYIFKYPNDGRDYFNKQKFEPGLDVRGDGGWIGWYGVNTDWSVPKADAPQALLDVIYKKQVDYSGESVSIAPGIAQQIMANAEETILDASEGERNGVLNTEAFKVGQLVSSGAVSREDANTMLTTAAKEIGLGDHEIKATIKSGLKGGDRKPMTSPFSTPVVTIDIPVVPVPERWTPQPFIFSDLTNRSNLRKPQLFENWSTEDIHLTTADGGTGKTTLKLFEAICLALGERFLGFRCLQPGKTLYITGEDSTQKIAAMIGMIAEQMGVLHDQQKIDTILKSIVVKKDSDLCIISKDRQGFLHLNPQAQDKLLQAVREIKPKMIVFDPISSFWGSEAALNDMAKAVSKFMGALVEESVACVEMINHMGKVSSNNKDMSQFAGRGGTGLPSHARVSRVYRPIGDEEYTELTSNTLEEYESAVMINVNKFTDGSPLLDKPFLAIRKGYLYRIVNLDDAKVREEKLHESDNERVFNFVKEMREIGKYPTKQVVNAQFMASVTNKLSTARVKRALDMLSFSGFKGHKLKTIDNPDASINDKALVITDLNDKEI
jgi:RecA-family ATPase